MARPASDGVTAAYAAEGTESSDNSPVLTQPDIFVYRWSVFVPFSIELGMDWLELQQELVQLAVDARNVNDATMFLTGNGTNQPIGILAVGTTGALTTTQRVQTNTVATYAVGDPWLLKAQIPPRFLPSATFAASPATWGTTYRFVAQGSTTGAAAVRRRRPRRRLPRPPQDRMVDDGHRLHDRHETRRRRRLLDT